jgi:hypothetical protein
VLVALCCASPLLLLRMLLHAVAGLSGTHKVSEVSLPSLNLLLIVISIGRPTACAKKTADSCSSIRLCVRGNAQSWEPNVPVS